VTGGPLRRAVAVLGHVPGDRFAGLVLAALAAAMVWETRKLPLGTLAGPGAGYWPLVLALALGALGLVIAWRGGASAALAALGWDEAPHAAAILAALAGAALLLERLGYRLTVIGLVAFLLGAVERKPPLVVAAVALGLALGSHFVFADMLKVPLPRGPFGY
jgi:putative tricarboxylic transport membrane protein